MNTISNNPNLKPKMKTKTLISILLFAFEIAQKIDIKVKPIPIFLLIFLTLHSNGQPISHWAKTYGGSSSEVNSTVLVTSDNCYLLTGETKSFGSGGYDIWLVKTKQNGDTLWTRTFGGGKNEYCYSA